MFQLIKIQKAIKFATKTHEVYQKQKRKGKDISYIIHPLTVGIILSQIGASEDVVCAGILHDTMEDCVPEKKVTFEMLEERFSENVANLVLAVTEADKSLSWEERKKLAKEHIKEFSHEAILVKSADILANTREMIQDYEKDGDQIFVRFNAPKEKLLKNYLETITILIDQWPDSPLMQELRFVSTELARMAETTFTAETPAKIIEYRDYDENVILECPVCTWKGKPEGNIEYYDDLFDVSCPNCDKMLLIVSYPLVKRAKALDEINEWASKLSLDQIQNMSENEILEYAMERPGHPGQYGFMLQMQYFKSQEEFAEIMHALMTRLGKIDNLKEKYNIDWQSPQDRFPDVKFD